ncbi:hypothetical protein ACWJKU_01860 [Methylocaldum sp. MU1018]
MSVSRFAKLLAQTETRIALAALLLAVACIGIGGVIADRFVTFHLLTGTKD